jgi:hypothetical protein
VFPSSNAQIVLIGGCALPQRVEKTTVKFIIRLRHIAHAYGSVFCWRASCLAFSTCSISSIWSLI